MRILALTPPDKQGKTCAQYTFLREELEGLAGAGAEVHALTLNPPTEKLRGGVIVHPVPRTRSLPHSVRAARALCFSPFPELSGASLKHSLHLARIQLTAIDVCRKHQIQLIYCPFAWPDGTAACTCSRVTGIPYIVSLRGADVNSDASISYGAGLDPLYRERLQAALKRADAVIAISSSLAGAARDAGARQGQVAIVHKGVDLSRFSPGCKVTARAALDLPPSPTMLYVGNLVPVKGISCLLESFLQARARVNDLRLVICGDGVLMPQVVEWRRHHELNDSVDIVGVVSRDRLPAYFRAADFLVLPSLSEGAGNVVLEAAATGCPSVVTNVGGLPDYVQNDVTGVLCRRGDADDFANRIVELCINQSRRLTMGRAAQDLMASNFRFDQMIERLFKVFKDVVTRKCNNVRMPSAAGEASRN